MLSALTDVIMVVMEVFNWLWYCTSFVVILVDSQAIFDDFSHLKIRLLLLIQSESFPPTHNWKFLFFSGFYESPPGKNYKHWYFNSTFVAYKMWCLMVVGVVTAYECIKFIARCILQRNIRWVLIKH